MGVGASASKWEAPRKEDDDIVTSSWKHEAVFNGYGLTNHIEDIWRSMLIVLLFMQPTQAQK